MKRKVGKTIVLLASIAVTVILLACQNSFLADETGLYNVSFVTNCDTKIDSYRTGKIESIQKLTKEGYVFDDWYTSRNFESSPITFPYELTQDITLYARWLKRCEIRFETTQGTAPNTMVIGAGKKISSEQMPAITSNGYFFDGWYIDEVRLENYVINGNITLTAKWLTKCEIRYETAQGVAPTSVITGKGKKITSEQLPELKSNDYVFDGWYIDDVLIVANEYVVDDDVTLTAKWVNAFTFNPAEIQASSDYVNGILTLKSDFNKIILKGGQSAVFRNLCIKVSNPNTKLVLDNFSFTSEKTSPLIESAFDISIEYKGTNNLSSSASDVDSLIKSSGTIEITGNPESTLVLQPNATTARDCAIVRANKVIINGGNLEINGSNGWNDSTSGRNGGNGSSGIKASETVIKNNAVVTITGGNGANGNRGKNGGSGSPGKDKEVASESAGRGGDGVSGEKGGDGGNGGDAVIGNLVIEPTARTVSLTGGSGGNGGKGGNGGTGGKGGDNYIWNSWTGHGGNGGNGGDGGNGGNGGNAVSGTLENQIGINAIVNHGKYGLGGSGGNGGVGGDRGYHKGTGYGKTGDPGNPGSPGNAGSNGKEGKDSYN